MMQTSEERDLGNLPDALDRSGERRVFAQGEVNPQLIRECIDRTVVFGEAHFRRIFQPESRDLLKNGA